MKLVKVTVKTPTIEDGKIVLTASLKKAIVASTKSENNFIDDLKHADFIINDVTSTEFYDNLDNLKDCLMSYIKTVYRDEELQQAILSHYIKCLNAGCVFEKPKK